MSELPADRPMGRFLKWALWGAALIGVAAVVYIMAQSLTKPPASPSIAKAPPGKSHSVASKLDHPADGSAAPAYSFNDAAGKAMTVADFKGKVVVLNLWATWCAPCKNEMPTLARLQAAYAGKPLVVLAVSIDKSEALEGARMFIAGLEPLAFYNDPAAKLPWALTPPAAGMPTTVIYGKDGLERGRISGEAAWSDPDAVAILDKVLAES